MNTLHLVLILSKIDFFIFIEYEDNPKIIYFS